MGLFIPKPLTVEASRAHVDADLEHGGTTYHVHGPRELDGEQLPGQWVVHHADGAIEILEDAEFKDRYMPTEKPAADATTGPTATGADATATAATGAGAADAYPTGAESGGSQA